MRSGSSSSGTSGSMIFRMMDSLPATAASGNPLVRAFPRAHRLGVTP
jgi:hypothetical protein